MSNNTLTGKSNLSIAVIGAGKIGSTFAYQLAKAGHDITVIARPGSKRLEQLQKTSSIVLTTFERQSVKVAGELDELAPFDLLIVTVLAHQVDAIIPALQRCKAKCIHFMFVTFEPEQLRDAIGAERCTFGMPAVMATLDDKGHLAPKIGRQKTQHNDQRWVNLFTNAGMPSALEPEMLWWLRSHVPFTAAMESICVAGKRRNGGATWNEAVITARGVNGGFALIKDLGYPVYPKAKASMSSWPIFIIAFMLWAMSRIKSFRDLLGQGVDESRQLIDAMVKAAARANASKTTAVADILAMKPGIADSGLMKESASGAAQSRSVTKKLLTFSVLVGPMFFVTVLTQGFTRAGFDITRAPLSLLSLGDLGWIQITNFIVAGLFALVGSKGIHRALAGSKGRFWAATLAALHGFGLVLAGVYHPDPGYNFPPGVGAPNNMMATMSTHALIHSIGFVFVNFPLFINCWVFFRTFRSRGQTGWSIYSAVTGIVGPLILIYAFSTHTTGLIVIEGMICFCWLSIVAAGLRKNLNKVY